MAWKASVDGWEAMETTILVPSSCSFTWAPQPSTVDTSPASPVWASSAAPVSFVSAPSAFWVSAAGASVPAAVVVVALPPPPLPQAVIDSTSSHAIAAPYHFFLMNFSSFSLYHLRPFCKPVLHIVSCFCISTCLHLLLVHNFLITSPSLLTLSCCFSAHVVLQFSHACCSVAVGEGWRALGP